MAKTVPLPCVSTAFAAETVPLPCGASGTIASHSGTSSEHFPAGGRGFCCDGCGMWGHLDCYVDYEGKTFAGLPPKIYCHRCRGAAEAPRAARALSSQFWQFKCVCGQKYCSHAGGENDDMDAEKPSGDTFECSGCNLWAHSECYRILTGRQIALGKDTASGLCFCCLRG